MKLISKTIFYFLAISIPLLLVAGYISYHFVRGEVREGTDLSLWHEKQNTEKTIAAFPAPQNKILSNDGLSRITMVKSGGPEYIFTDTLIYDNEEEEDINHRVLNSFVKINGQNYRITLAKPTFEEEALIEGLATMLSLIFVFMLITFFVLNWLISRWLWSPFYKTIEVLQRYDLKSHKHTEFPITKTKEFRQLNEALGKMTDKIYLDYIHQKEFTENAAHEMQTPLAVMKAKLDLLIQSPNLKEEEMNQLQVLDTSVSKLASLNKALLLLAKIENNQFKDISDISLQKVIDKVLVNYEELIDSKNITLQKNFGFDLHLKINPVLCDVLVSNLVQNAIRHNTAGGKIFVSVAKNSLSVSNSGEPLKVNSEELFVRFKKNDASKDSIGLGLSIVKSICELYGYEISYSYSEKMHSFILRF